MFSLKFDLFFSNLLEAKNLIKKINRRLNRPQHYNVDPRELQRMRAELQAAREHARLMNVFNRTRIF